MSLYVDLSVSLLQAPGGAGADDAAGQHPLEEASASQLVIVDGIPSLQLSNLSSIPKNVFVGGIQHAPNQVISEQLVSHKTLLASAQQVICSSACQSRDALKSSLHASVVSHPRGYSVTSNFLQWGLATSSVWVKIVKQR